MLSFSATDSVWNALSNPHRRKLLDLMREGPQTTGDLAEQFPELSRYAVMQHLNVLVEAGLVLARKKGRYRFNYLNPVPIQRVYERWMRPFAAPVAESMMALEKHLQVPEQEKKMKTNETRYVTIEAEIPLNASPEKVFEALTTGLNDWWPLRAKENATVMVEGVVGGKIYEDWGNQGGFLYGHWAVYDPPHRAVLVGTSTLTPETYQTRNSDTVEATENGSVYKKSYVLWGNISKESENRIRNGVKFLSGELKKFVETDG
jgi:DNA-binding transcriptional ArsR family regulator